MMKTAGIIGGIGPESTIAYYRLIVSMCRERSGRAPSLLINSIDVATLLDLAARDELDALAEYLLTEVERLARGGADFAALAANTPHIVFDALSARAPIPLVSIVDATAAALAARALRRVALFGTRFTMEGGFYEAPLQQRGIDLVLPEPAERARIHHIYTEELLRNVFAPESREWLLHIVDRLHERHSIDAVILGGTELPLLLTEPSRGTVALIDTTRVHAEAIVNAMLGA